MYKIPLSPYAKIFYIEWQVDQNRSDYNIVFDSDIHGSLNVTRLTQAIEKLISDHVILNSHIKEQMSELYWVKNRDVYGLECFTDQLSNKDILEYIEKPFDLEKGPLYRFALIKISKNQYRFIIVFHHLLIDGVSFDYFFNELSKYYNDQYYKPDLTQDDQILPIAKFTKKLAEYVEHNREYSKAFWRKHLSNSDFLNLSFLSSNFNEKKVVNNSDIITELTPQALNGVGENRFNFNKTVLLKLNLLKDKYGIIPYSYGHMIFAILLYRYTRQDSFCINYPVSMNDKINFIYGAQVNTNVISYDFSKFNNVLDIIKHSQDFIQSLKSEEFNHSFLPIYDIISASNKGISDASFIQTNLKDKVFEFNGTKITSHEGTNIDLPNKLLFEQEVRDGSINYRVKFRLDYVNSHLLNEFIACYKRLFEEILEELVQSNDKKLLKNINHYQLLTKTQYNQITGDWNQTKNNYAHNKKTIQSLFEEQVKRSPNNIAVIYEDKELTYKQLNEKANQLAHYLRSLGVGPDTLVAIAVERSLEMVIGLLGILKAGGAYIPLDPTYPEERLAFMLEDTGSPLLITESNLKKHFGSYDGKQILIDKDWGKIEKESKNNPQQLNVPGHLAYVIYTSGSTGKPKGVMIEHQSLTNYIVHAQKTYPIAKGISLFHSSYAFDMSITSLFLPLVQGNSIGIVVKTTDTEALVEFIKTHDNLNIIKLTPTHLRALRWQLNEFDPCKKAVLVIGGEALLEEDIGYWREASPHSCIYNEYGPTEATVGCCVYQVEEERGLIPIGRPIANVEMYILDTELQPVPIGVTGEIYIGGAGLARGYWGRPELTAECFIPNPFGNNTRLYKTGDLARYLADGNIEFLGRSDDQVKVRGYRIELGEIESILVSHADVAQVVVVAREDEPGNKKIVAYVVPGEFTPSHTELREYTENILPEYMVPSFFVYLDKIPLTANGKIDRKVLPSPDTSLRLLGDIYVAPRNEKEKKLCEIWSEVLGKEQVGIMDHFFRIGGDSIISIQLVSKARQKGIRFSVKDVFNHPTIEALASISQDKGESSMIQPQQDMVSGEVLLTPIQHWFFKQELIKPSHFNQSVLLEIKEKLNSSVLTQALNDLVLHHDSLRLRYRQKEGSWNQDYIPLQNQSILKKVDLALHKGQSLTDEITKICNDTQASFDLEQGPLIKVVLMDCGKESQRLLIILHHLVVDGVSWRILLEDLEKLYEQSLQGQAAHLPPKTHSYQQWSSILQEYAKSEELQSEESYWQEVEAKIRPLPFDKIDTKVTKDKLETIHVTLSKEETRRLLQEVPHAYRTEINDSLLTALALTIEEWTGKDGVSISLEGHGREEIVDGIDVSRTIGWFTTIFPVYLETQEKDIGSALKAIKEILREIPNKGIGYGILRYLGGKKEITESPSISFNYLGQWDQQQECLWSTAQESMGISVASENTSPYSLNINSEVRDGQLQIYCTYNSKHYTSQTIEKIGDSFISHLQTLIEHCCQEGVYGYTPSDFSLAQLTQTSLDQNFGKQEMLEEIYPLSPLQEGLLFQALYEPDSDSYFVQSVLRIEGRVNEEALKNAWQKVSDHHEVLRTGFVWEGLDKPLQYVLERVEVPFEVEDWSKLTEKQQEEKLEICIKEDRQRSFELREAPLFRIKLIKCSKDYTYMVWSSHHILSDGWSTPIILGDVLRAYEDLVNNKEVKLKYRAPYKNYIVWLQEQDAEKGRKYWQEKLGSIEEPTRLSFKTVIEEPSTGKDYDTYGLELSIEETEGLQRFAREQQVTLNTVLQGALGLLLQHYTQKTEVVMGVTISGRTIELDGIEEMVGLFINTLPLKVSCQRDDTVESYLHNLQEQTQQLNEHADTSLAQIYGWTSQHKGLFDVLFVFENYPIEEMVREGGKSFQITNVRAIDRIEYPLAILVGPGKQLHLRFSYQTEHFDKVIIKRMSEHLRNLLCNMQVQKEAPRALSYLTTEERQQLVETWNATQQPYPEDKLISQLFEEQVKRSPNNIAVIYGDEELTYKQLNEKANQLAHFLRKQGVGPDTLVAIAVERSLGMVIGLLGILKAGGAYVPLDPTYPEERLAFMLEDTGTSFLITQSQLKETLEPVINSYTGQVVMLDELTQKVTISCNINNLLPLSTPSNLAYVIYTSGSTGKPKGVMVKHRSLVSFLMDIGNQINIDNTSRLLGVTTLAFDIAGLEIYSPLLNGGVFILLNQEVTLDPDKLAEAIVYHDATIMQATPTTWQLLVDNHWKGKKNLKALCGGENVNLYLLKQLVNKVEHVWNLYGPTETTIWSSSRYYTKDEEKAISTVSIGTPIWNTEIYILDSHFNPVPVGVVGEIYIGGIGLARGYLNRPDLTAERFVPNPFINKDKTIQSHSLRLYRTGDIARYIPGGNIEFVGRIDDQVKIRGFRIELGEIESTLSSYVDVAQAIVIAREDEPGHQRLVAYVVPKQTNTDTSTSEGIARWQNVYNDVYKEIKKSTDVTFNTVGWNSSYTGEPIPDVDMAEWVENTINQIHSLMPKRVLEIGCGAGLLLSRIAPHCQAYWGTDFSERAINHLNILRKKIPTLKHVQLLRRDANNFEDIKEDYFDVIVLNSVVQYFPNVDYLKNVLKGAVRSLRKGGVIFIGDIRNLSLLKTYASSIECFRSSENETRTQIEKYIDQRLGQEKELVIDPRFFLAIQEALEEISHIKIQPKRGEYENELTKFRYDVFLYVHNEIQTQQIKWVNWKNTEHSLSKIEEYLIKDDPSSYGLQQVHNARLQSENEFLNWLQKAEEKASLKDFNTSLGSLKTKGINPEDLWQLGKHHGYKVEISWHNAYENGAYDVAFVKEHPNTVDLPVSFQQNSSNSELNSYVNYPSQKIENIERSLYLQKYLQESLPDYMIPSFFVYIEQIPLTPNGKIDRRALPAPDFSSRSLGDEYVAPRNERERELCEIWSVVLGIEQIGIKDHFFRIGGDSIISIQLVLKARQKGIKFSVKDVFNHPTVEELTSVSQDKEEAPTLQIEQGIASGEVFLTPIQHWFFKQKLIKPHHFNQTVLLQANKKLDVSALTRALKYLALHHDGLRLRYEQKDGAWYQEYMLPQDQPILKEADLSFYQGQHLTTEITKICDDTQESFDLSEGPLIKTVLMNCGKEPQRLLIVLHHLVGDGVSWRILLEDLEKIYEQEVKGQTISLPSKTHSYQRWSGILQKYAKSKELQAEESYWQEVEAKIRPLPFDEIDRKEKEDKLETIHVTLNKEETRRLLQEVPRVYQTEINDSLLTALALAVEEWTGTKGVSLCLQGHGREEIVKGIDVSRTVGWFTTIFPVYLETSETQDISVTLKIVKEILRAIPNKGIGYGILRYLGGTKEVTESPSISFNYLGQWDQQQQQLWITSPESTGMSVASENTSPYKIIINAEVRGEQLQIYYTYNRQHYIPQTIDKIGNRFINHLQKLIEHCCQG